MLAHLARSADAMRNLLIGARSGADRPAYASAEARAAAIEQGAQQQSADLVADVASAAMAFRTLTRPLPGEAWQYQVQILGSAPFPVGQLLIRRLVEVELHHCDLGLATARPAGRTRSPRWSCPSRCAPSARTACPGPSPDLRDVATSPPRGRFLL